MKMKPKEILKNKSDKMIDLIVDDVEPGSSKELTAGFLNKNIKYKLTVKVETENINKPTIPEPTIPDDEDEF